MVYNKLMFRYSSSKKRVLYVFFVILISFVLTFSFAHEGFDVYGLKLGLIFGTLMGLFPLFFGLGQTVFVENTKISYSSNLIDLLFRKSNLKQININDIKFVGLGIPKMNKNVASFAAINISSEDKEITFNPDLFDTTTLKKLFSKLNSDNSNISFDKYSSAILEAEKPDKIFRKVVIKNFSLTVVLMMVMVLLLLYLNHLNVVSTKLVFSAITMSFIFLPLIYNRMCEKARRK